MFSDFLESLPVEQRDAFKNIIDVVHSNVPDAKEGLSYGLPAFKYLDRPLIGFSSNKAGFNIYPFDPRVIERLEAELEGFELSKGVIRFTLENQLSKELILLIVDLRIEYLENRSR